MTTKKLFLYFPTCETEKPIVYHLVKDYDLVINIYRAKVTPEEHGYLVLDITGEDTNIERATEFVKTLGVTVNESRRGLQWEATRCTSCGNCVPRCPTGALHIPDRSTMEVTFDNELCIECLNCVKNCPFDACYSMF